MNSEFRLVRYFSIASLIIIVAAALVLSLLHREITKRNMVEMMQQNSVMRAQSLIRHLWIDIEPLLHSLEGLDKEALRANPTIADIQDIVSRKLKDHFKGLDGPVKVKIFNLQGLTIFSSDPLDISKNDSRNVRFIAALNGETSSKLIYRSAFSDFNKDHEPMDLIESYVPVRHGGPKTPVEAVFELYYEVTPFVRQIGQAQWGVVTGVILTLLVVYGVLFWIVARADRVIRRQGRELSESERRLRSVTDSTSEAIITTNIEGNVISWNKGASIIFGYSVEEMLGKRLTMLIPEKYKARHEAALKRVRETGETRLIGKTTELSGIRKNSEEFLLELTIGMWKASGETFFSGIIRDISERKETEEQLRQAQKVEAIGSLAGGIAHDLNNMLLPILTLSGMTLKNLPEDSNDRHRLEKVVQATERAKDLVARILAFSRQEEDVKQEKVDIYSVVREAMGILHSTIPSTIEINEHLDEETGTFFVDAGQIQTMLMNLASNAIDAMDGKTGRIDISLKRTEITAKRAGGVHGLKPGTWARLTVEDNGCGMDEETLERIYDPFFTTKGVGEGTGLGLSMVHGFVRHHGGAINVSSKPGEGTIFDVYLPLVKGGK
jgi:PAS domain S-box-containing protein